MTKSKKSVLVTGTSGSGKTTLSKKLNEMGYKAYDMDDEPGLFAMLDKKTKKPVVDHNNDDLEKVMKMDWICDKDKLISIMEHEPSSLAFYCGAASNIEDLLPLFDKVILLKAGEAATRERLSSRTNNDFGRTTEVQDWIMSWKNHWDSEVEDKGAIVIDTHKSIDEVAKEVIEKAET